jgi:purine-binding chemotaxis protein CheW
MLKKKSGNGSSKQDRTSTLALLKQKSISAEQFEEILQQRAVELAKPAKKPKTTEASSYLFFTLGEEQYAIDVSSVKEIRPLSQYAVVPCSPKPIIGVVNIRGNIICLVDVRRFFNLPERENKVASKVIVVEVGEWRLGIVADQVCGVNSIANSEISTVTEALSGIDEELTLGITKDMTVILNILSIVKDKRISSFEKN